MGEEATYNMIRQTVRSVLPGSRIVLFGSRAPGVHDRFSDYDLLVITKSTYSPQEEIYWSSQLNRAIVNAIQAPIDLLLNSEEEINEKKELPGHIIRSIIREGVVLGHQRQ
ncbi:MAG: nucleotidyltransferase domain-containing protein [Bacteroidetes bacterium]|nr:nucleotidyltransferase domain-containing protein [Bacteroidota bacterium]